MTVPALRAITAKRPARKGQTDKRMTFDFFDTADSIAALQNDHDTPATSPEADPAHSKKFHINDILSLSTGMMLAREGAAGVYRLAAFVMDDNADSAHTRAHLETVKTCLREQLPFLSDVGMEALETICKVDPSAANPYLTVWLEMQALRHGDEHAVMTYAAWQAQKEQNSPRDAANCNQLSGKAASA